MNATNQKEASNINESVKLITSSGFTRRFRMLKLTGWSYPI